MVKKQTTRKSVYLCFIALQSLSNGGSHFVVKKLNIFPSNFL